MRYLSELPRVHDETERTSRKPAPTGRIRLSPRLLLDVVVVVACILIAIGSGLLGLWWGSVLLSVVAVGGLLDFVLIAGPKHRRWRVLTTDLGTREP